MSHSRQSPSIGTSDPTLRDAPAAGEDFRLVDLEMAIGLLERLSQ